MPHALHFLVLALAGWVTRHQEDRIDSLREENRVLREHLGPRPLRLTDAQCRRLAVRGQKLGRRILSQVAGIVTPDTISPLVPAADRPAVRWPCPPARRGRPMTPWAVAELVVRMADEHPTWGDTRIRGALANLGHHIARNTVKRILHDPGLDPAPERTQRTPWKTFLQTHWEGLAAAATINRETSALSRMLRLVVQWDWLPSVPVFPGRLRENPPRQGFFEHGEYLAVRAALPAPYQDVLDFAYYSGWRKHEILNLTWDEVDLEGGVIRLSPHRSKTGVGRVLPISLPLAEVLARRQRKHRGDDQAVFRRDDVTVRVWRTAWRAACRQAGVPTRLLHDCRRTAARNLIRAGVPERVAMVLTGHKTRAVFDRYNIVNERDLFAAGEQLVSYLRTK